jgi:hypothetical protein
MDGAPRCKHCGDVIGAYEPMVVIDAGRPRGTSRAAEDGALLEESYHEACYLQARSGEDSRD